MNIPAEATAETKAKLEGFLALINKEPKEDELKKTPDGKAHYLPMSYVEMSLDEYFFGQWSTENFRWQQIQNEIVASIDLVVVNPINGFLMRRTGSASLQIMVDKVPDSLTGAAKNLYSLDPQNKKPNALDQGFPKLKTDCIKNAALSLGKVFGRDLNRKHSDTYRPIISGSQQAMVRVVNEAIEKGDFDSAKSLLSNSKIAEDKKFELFEKIKVKAELVNQ